MLTQTMRRAIGPVAACVVLLVGVASCGSTGPPRTHRAARPVTASYGVTTGEVKGLGTILVDGGGYTLYLFLPDDHASRSQCAGICADEWPPLLLPKGITAAVGGGGIRPSLLGTTVRSDGGVQVTYNGWPLYTWPDDLSPGQATGQGLNNVGGVWYVVSPEGNPIRS